MRTVKIHLNQSQMIAAAEAIGTWDKLWEAIGYLSTWAGDTYAECEIYLDRASDPADLLAVYKDGATGKQYVIGAVWHDDHYGYHS